jgi:predicted TIM-barrel enzyme
MVTADTVVVGGGATGARGDPDLVVRAHRVADFAQTLASEPGRVFAAGTVGNADLIVRVYVVS